MKQARLLYRLKWITAVAFSLVAGIVAAEQPAATTLGNDPLVKELLRRLEERDALISNLQQRVNELERQVGILAQDREPPTAAPPVAARPTSPVAPATQPPQPKPAPPIEAPAREAPAEERDVAQAAPGQFEVDEQAAERALERTLVTTGNLLLPFGQAEIQSGFTYTRRQQDAPVFFREGELQNVASLDIRRNILDANLGLRFGLPLDSQLELDFPYRYVDQETVVRVAFNERDETDGHGSGFGDIRIGLAKTLLRERRWWPDVIGRVTWDTATGETTDNDIALFGGFNELEGSLSLTKRQDPLVFIGRAAYETTFENDDIEPGDALSFSVGAVLAASPETSLRAILSQSFIDDLKINGEVINGSNQVLGTLSLGASSIIGRGKFFDLTAGVGLTDDAPDYSAGVSLSIFFDVLPRF